MKSKSTESSDTDNANNIKVPSPLSAFSLHSTKQPLEWDSGADVGYLCNTNSNISIQNFDISKITRIKKLNIKSPLAKSTPIIREVSDLKFLKPNSNFKKPTDNTFKVASCNENTFSLESNKSFSRSLDNLRNVASSSKACEHVRELSCEDGEKIAYLRLNKKNSSSSISTVIPIISAKSNNVNDVKKTDNSNTVFSKAVRDVTRGFNNVSIADLDNDNPETSNSTDGNERSTESFSQSKSKVSNVDCTYVKNHQDKVTKYSGSGTTSNINSTECFSGSDSFKYISGNNYEYESYKKVLENENDPKFVVASNNETDLTESTVNSIDSKVQYGVNLVKQYVNELNSFKKNKIEKKIGEVLLNHKNIESQAIIKSNSICEPKQEQSYVYKKESPAEYVANSKTAENSHCSENNLEYINALKKYLSKDREFQLMWIRSANDYLNNLKRLHENQEKLRKFLLSKSVNKCISQKEVRSSQKTARPAIDDRSSEAKSNEVKSTSSQTETVSSSRCSRCRERNNIKKAANKILKSDHRCYLNELDNIILSEESRQRRSYKRKPTNLDYIKRINSDHLYLKSKKENINVKYKSVGSTAVPVSYSSSAKLSVSNNKYKTDSKPCLGYTISFEKSPPKHRQPKSENINISAGQNKLAKCSLTSAMKGYGASLQDYLERNKPEYVQCAEIRRSCLAEMAYLRDLRSKTKKELVTLLDNSDEDIVNSVKRIIPPPALATMRIFDRKTMRKQTEEKYRQLPEVVENECKKDRQQAYQTNRIMVKIFNKKLQRRVLKGEINLSNSASVISS